ncbi:MAG TPA: apolipoprotein N-acyltransferase [Pyrinomonadaceae bacterium]|nr:apolipoprotein N-acyltransferase [Pyrinomonadaceae bacterium]
MRQVVFRRSEWAAAGATTLLLIFSFPNFELYYLAWIALVPLLVTIARRPSPRSAFILGWAAGSVFFYVSCYWLTYSMIHYGGLPTLLAYVLLIPGALVVGVFPGLFALLFALAIQKWGHIALLLAPVFWTALEFIRLSVTGQLWNAIGYSQAYNPFLIQAANWGGVYAVSFLIVSINSAVALLTIKRTRWTIAAALSLAALVGLALLLSPHAASTRPTPDELAVNVVAIQPNVPMTMVKTPAELKELLERHLLLSTKGLQSLPDDKLPRLVIWPESPMNFTYGSTRAFQELVADFTKRNHTSLLFNSLEAAPANGSFNSALLVNEEGHLISQYDKIRLMPFGEYVPLPQWLPGASLITGIVGDFTPGGNYTLMPFGEGRAGVFICIESAYPWIARTMANEGADVLINISNDGYLGPTAVMRQHLANAVFRAVENGRPLLRVTNTGLSAFISADGVLQQQTGGFEVDVRNWSVNRSTVITTFYTRYGDLFVYLCTAITFLIVSAIFFGRVNHR